MDGTEPTSKSINPHNPISNVIYVPLEKIFANNYNPNSVALMEMKLLYVSIKNDGYTQPVVTIYDEAKDRYVIVDGFHRYSIMKMYADIRELNGGLLPVVVLKSRDINHLMASTIRHNRARGKHSSNGMSQLIITMLNNKTSDADICNNLGLEPEELIRLKHITGYAKLYENKEFTRAKYTKEQVDEKLKYEKEQADASR